MRRLGRCRATRAASGGAIGSGREGESRISRVDAQGHVVITDALNTGRGDYGVYNGDTGIATLIGNVVIQRGVNVIRGQRGVMDLNNNIARMMPGDGPGEGGQRVQGLFVRDQATPARPPARRPPATARTRDAGRRHGPAQGRRPDR